MNLIESKNILVTGGAGFIGSELVRQLLETGCRVVTIDNLSNGNIKNLPESRKLSFIKGDFQDDSALDKAFSCKIDVIYHLACLGVRHSIHSPYENHLVNADGTLKLLSRAKKEKVSRLVYVSSSEIYGTARWAPMDEDYPPIPETVYGASKLAGECYARAYYRTYSFPTVMLRPFNSFGPRSHHEGDSGEVIPKFLLRALTDQPINIFGDGTQTRDFTYVSDTATAILCAGKLDNVIGETINIGSGQETSILELVDIIKSILNNNGIKINFLESRPGDVRRLCANSDKAKKLLQFKPKFDLKSGLNELLNWYRNLEIDYRTLLMDEKIKNWEICER